MRDAHKVQRLFDAIANLGRRPLHLQRAVRNLVKDCWIEKLYVGILKDECDPTTKGEREIVSLEFIAGQDFLPELYRSLGRKTKTIQQPK